MADHHLPSLLADLLRASAWLLLMSVVFLPFERLFAVQPRRWFTRATGGDILFYFISGVVPGLVLAPLLGVFAVAAHMVLPGWATTFGTVLPLWARVGAALIVSEIGFYWGHRWSHEIPFLWRFHAVHHAPEEIYFLVSARAHPLDNVFVRLCGFVPVYSFGLATPLTPGGGVVSALLVVVLTTWGFLIHANVRWRFGLLEWIVATPAFHHWHHTSGEPRDRNYASMLPVLDMVFGTFHLPCDWPGKYGTDTAMPNSVAGQLIQPLLPASRSSVSNATVR